MDNNRDNKPENIDPPYTCPSCGAARSFTMGQLMAGEVGCACGWKHSFSTAGEAEYTLPRPAQPPVVKFCATCGEPAGDFPVMHDGEPHCRDCALAVLTAACGAEELEKERLRSRLEELELQLARALEDIATQRRVYEERLHRVRCERDRLAWRRGHRAMRPEVVS